MSENDRGVHPKFLKWIEDNGGTAGVAELLNVSLRSVQWWQSGHQIPNSLVLLEILNRAPELTPLDVIYARKDYFVERKIKIKTPSHKIESFHNKNKAVR